jgi:hypothetical protein
MSSRDDYENMRASQVFEMRVEDGRIRTDTIQDIQQLNGPVVVVRISSRYSGAAGDQPELRNVRFKGYVDELAGYSAKLVTGM